MERKAIKNRHIKFILIIIPFLLSGCEKKEVPAPEVNGCIGVVENGDYYWIRFEVYEEEQSNAAITVFPYFEILLKDLISSDGNGGNPEEYLPEQLCSFDGLRLEHIQQGIIEVRHDKLDEMLKILKETEFHFLIEDMNGNKWNEYKKVEVYTPEDFE